MFRGSRRLAKLALVATCFYAAVNGAPGSVTQLFGESAAAWLNQPIGSHPPFRLTAEFDRPALRAVGDTMKVRLTIAPVPFKKTLKLDYIPNAMGAKITGPLACEVNLRGVAEFTLKCTVIKNAGTCDIYATTLNVDGSAGEQFLVVPKVQLKPK